MSIAIQWQKIDWNRITIGVFAALTAIAGLPYQMPVEWLPAELKTGLFWASMSATILLRLRMAIKDAITKAEAPKDANDGTAKP